MSKSNRRRQRPGYQPPSTRGPGTSGPNPNRPNTAGSGRSDASGTTATTGLSGAGATAATGAAAAAGTPRATGTTPRPTSATAARHGRRERQRAAYKPSFMERYRTAIVVTAAVAGVVLLSAFVFLSASQPVYACSTIFSPQPTPAPAPGATPQLGYVQPDMGNSHVAVGEKVTYAYCAPASGSHYNASGRGPIAARVYAPTDNVPPEGWVHNLEHGALVVLYQGTSAGATAEGQAALKAFYDSFPISPRCGLAKGQLGPVIARFDDMATPFEAIIWDRVLPLQTFDQAQILAFFNQSGERTNPEDQCPSIPRTPVTQSALPDASGSPATSTASSAAPSTGPSASAAPSN
ncbi:MAG: hypothetical protein QOC97_913 [Chloroflexota bacterium]|nr:hypothetical protein [Chloroflexota bacterium]